MGILTCEQSTTFIKTLSNLHKQEYKPQKVIIIKNVFPVSKAVSQLINKVKTEFVIVLDDDITFKQPDALNIFVSQINHSNMNEVLFMLEDPIFGKIKGIRIYRTQAIKDILSTLKITRDWDVDINEQLLKDNKTSTIDFIIGNHHEQWSDLDLYWKMFTVAKKLKRKDPKYRLKRIQRDISSLMKISQNEKLILFAFAGLIDGLRDKEEGSFLSYQRKFNNELYNSLLKTVEDATV